MPPGSLLHVVSLLCWASAALALRALHMITGTSYRVSFLWRCESELSFWDTWQARGGSFPKLSFRFIRGKPCTLGVCGLLVLLGVRSLTSRLSAMRRVWWGHLKTQYVIFFLESPRLLGQGLYLSLILALASFHTFALVKVALVTHGRQSTSWGCWHFCFIPTNGANVDTWSIEGGFLL